MSVNVPEDLMGFTVSTVSHPQSLCFYYNWLQNIQVIILVCNRMIESLSSKEPWPLANATSLPLNTPHSPLTPRLCFYPPRRVDPFHHCSAILAKCCFYIELVCVSFFHICPKAAFFKLPRHFSVDSVQRWYPEKKTAHSDLSISQFPPSRMSAILVWKSL